MPDMDNTYPSVIRLTKVVSDYSRITVYLLLAHIQFISYRSFIANA